MTHLTMILPRNIYPARYRHVRRGLTHKRTVRTRTVVHKHPSATLIVNYRGATIINAIIICYSTAVLASECCSYTVITRVLHHCCCCCSYTVCCTHPCTQPDGVGQVTKETGTKKKTKTKATKKKKTLPLQLTAAAVSHHITYIQPHHNMIS